MRSTLVMEENVNTGKSSRGRKLVFTYFTVIGQFVVNLLTSESFFGIYVKYYARSDNLRDALRQSL